MFKSLFLLALLLPTADTSPKAFITDRFGNPPQVETSPGNTIILSANGSVNGGDDSSVVWIVNPSSLNELAQNFWDRKLGPILVIPVPSTVTTDLITITQISILDNKSDIATLNIKCNHGPRPGPQPDPRPKPKPDPSPIPVNTKLHVCIIDSVRERTPDTALILNADKFWDKLVKEGNSYLVYEKSSNETLPDGRAVNTLNITKPRLIVYNKANNKTILETDLPKTLEDLVITLNLKSLGF